LIDFNIGVELGSIGIAAYRQAGIADDIYSPPINGGATNFVERGK
jgi:hypothetical protein